MSINKKELSVGQGIGAGIEYINQLRADELLVNLIKQDINLDKAINELNELRVFVGDPTKILGDMKSKHGEIAEFAHVHISNARENVVGRQPSHMMEADRFSPVDYWRGDTPIQSKFIQGSDIRNCLTNPNGIEGHLKKYPDFLKNGGKYQIPKDQYEATIKLLSKPQSELNRSEYTTVQRIREFEEANNVKFENVVKPSVVEYKDVQLGKIDETINKEENDILKTDEAERERYREQAKATLKQGVKVAAISAAIEGTLSFILIVADKFKQGKRIGDFTEEDWKEIFADTGAGTVRGGARGASVYALTNFTKVNALVAVSLVTVAFGSADQTIKFANGEINQKEYIDSLQRLGGETIVSGVGAAIGQTLIPIPVVGAMIGSLVGGEILGRTQQFADRHLSDAIFIRDIEIAYYNMIDSIEDSSVAFERALLILDQQQKEFMNKRQQDAQLSDKLNTLLDKI